MRRLIQASVLSGLVFLEPKAALLAAAGVAVWRLRKNVRRK